jgi:hypothetical protein
MRAYPVNLVITLYVMQYSLYPVARFAHEKCNFSDFSDIKKKISVPWWRTGKRWTDPAGPPLLGYLHFSFLESKFWKINVFLGLQLLTFLDYNDGSSLSCVVMLSF